MARDRGRRRPKRAGDLSEEEREARLGASREIGHALRTIRSVRTLYVACAICAGLWLLLFLLVALPDNAAWRWMVAIAGASTVLLAIGSVQVVRKPIPWSIGIAIVVSLFAGLNYLVLGPGLHSAWGILIALALWASVSMAMRAQRLMERFPDLYITERWRGTRAKPKETERGRHVRDRHRAARQSALRAWALPAAGAVLVVLAVVFWPERSGTETAVEEPPPPSLTPRRQAF